MEPPTLELAPNLVVWFDPHERIAWPAVVVRRVEQDEWAVRSLGFWGRTPEIAHGNLLVDFAGGSYFLFNADEKTCKDLANSCAEAIDFIRREDVESQRPAISASGFQGFVKLLEELKNGGPSKDDTANVEKCMKHCDRCFENVTSQKFKLGTVESARNEVQRQYEMNKTEIEHHRKVIAYTELLLAKALSQV